MSDYPDTKTTVPGAVMMGKILKAFDEYKLGYNARRMFQASTLTYARVGLGLRCLDELDDAFDQGPFDADFERITNVSTGLLRYIEILDRLTSTFSYELRC